MSGAFASVEDAMRSVYGSGANIARTDRVSGGDINAAYRLTLTDGMRVFMKANHQKDVAFFKAEADLAMTELFDGFSGTFYSAYKKAPLYIQAMISGGIYIICTIC